MSLIQIIIILAVLSVWWRLFSRLRAQEIKRSEFWEWLLLWLVIGVVGLEPKIASYMADVVGVGRGSDLIIYLSILLVFYLLFKIFVRLEKFDKNLTKVVRAIAIQTTNKPNNKDQL
ncbi:MAG: DUF2304 family protein [Patescibacteria group bacterium]